MIRRDEYYGHWTDGGDKVNTEDDEDEATEDEGPK